MLSLLLITALALQNPPAASKPATQDTATTPKRTATTAPRAPLGPAVARMAFHDRMRDLWTDHVVYTRNFILSATTGQPDTAEVLQRLLRNQDEIGEAIKPYYGDVAGTQLTSLLRNHIQLAGKALIAAKGTSTAMQPGVSVDASSAYTTSRMPSDTVSARADSTKAWSNSQRPTTGRMADTSKAHRGQDSMTVRSSTGRMNDTTKAKQPAVQPTIRIDSTVQSPTYAQAPAPTTPVVDSASLNQAVAALKANGDSIATFLATANPRGFPREAMRGALQMHITLLLQEVTAQLKKDYSGSVAAFDESQRQAAQMADMLSDGIMKQFPSRFTNRATTVSSR
jgi:hypothetical protein